MHKENLVNVILEEARRDFEASVNGIFVDAGFRGISETKHPSHTPFAY